MLTDVERGVATGFTPDAAAFFDLVRAHTIEGMFGDPYHGGNANRWGFSHEVPNLGVLGASVMGTSGARNPTLTSQALAWRTADYLAANWKAVSG